MGLAKARAPKKRKKPILPAIMIVVFLLIVSAVLSVLYLTIQDMKRQQGSEDVSEVDQKILDMFDRR